MKLVQVGEERGSTLTLVTWVFLILGVTAAYLIYRTKLEWTAASVLEKRIQAREIAEEVLQERLAILQADQTETDDCRDPWFDGGRFQLEVKGHQVTVVTEDEGSKPNLNLLTEKGLKRLSGGENVDPILDWRDPDDDRRPEGAENNYYQGLNPPYKPRNGFFSSTAELRQVKNGAKLYPLIAPAVTVFGRVNPNTVSAETLSNFLLSSGFDQGWVDSLTEEFKEYIKKNRYQNLDDFRKNSRVVTIDTLERLKSLFCFEGNANLNLIGRESLEIILEDAGYSTGIASGIISYRDQKPFNNPEEFEPLFKSGSNQESKRLPRDYFTTVSTIIRYRIWVEKNGSRYYLDAVYQRVPGGLKEKWKAYPLSWREAFNQQVEEIPPQPNQGEQTGIDGVEE